MITWPIFLGFIIAYFMVRYTIGIEEKAEKEKAEKENSNADESPIHEQVNRENKQE